MGTLENATSQGLVGGVDWVVPAGNVLDVIFHQPSFLKFHAKRNKRGKDSGQRKKDNRGEQFSKWLYTDGWGDRVELLVRAGVALVVVCFAADWLSLLVLFSVVSANINSLALCVRWLVKVWRLIRSRSLYAYRRLRLFFCIAATLVVERLVVSCMDIFTPKTARREGVIARMHTFVRRESTNTVCVSPPRVLLGRRSGTCCPDFPREGQVP